MNVAIEALDHAGAGIAIPAQQLVKVFGVEFISYGELHSALSGRFIEEKEHPPKGVHDSTQEKIHTILGEAHRKINDLLTRERLV